MLRMEIAARLCLDRKNPDDKILLERFLGKLKSDNEWDDTCQKQTGYKAMGLTRYHVNWADTVVQGREEDVVVEGVTSVTQHGAVSSQLMIGDKPSIVIKVESPEFLELQKQIKVLAAGESRLTKLTSELQKLKVQVGGYKGSACPSGTTDHC
jgi:hypothetical protein